MRISTKTRNSTLYTLCRFVLITSRWSWWSTVSTRAISSTGLTSLCISLLALSHSFSIYSVHWLTLDSKPPSIPITVGESLSYMFKTISLYGETLGRGPPPVGGFFCEDASFFAFDTRSFHFFLISPIVLLTLMARAFTVAVISLQTFFFFGVCTRRIEFG